MSENPILKELSYDQSAGSLRYKGVRYLLIRPETIAGMQKAIVDSCGHDAGDHLWEGGYAGGKLSAEKYRDIHNFSDHEIIEFMLVMGNRIGWGNFNLDRYDPEAKNLSITVTHSPFAEAYGSSNYGVCHLIRGVLAGMAAVLFGGDCTAAETECRARGDKACRFLIEASQ